MICHGEYTFSTQPVQPSGLTENRPGLFEPKNQHKQMLTRYTNDELFQREILHAMNSPAGMQARMNARRNEGVNQAFHHFLNNPVPVETTMAAVRDVVAIQHEAPGAPAGSRMQLVIKHNPSTNTPHIVTAFHDNRDHVMNNL